MQTIKRTYGFTLIEIVIAISIIGVLAVFVNIQWPGTKISYSAEAEQVASDARYAQALSMTQGVRFCLKISGSTYQIIDSATSTAVILGTGGTTITLGSGISFGTLVPSGLTLLVFDGNGTPYSSSSTTCTTATAAAATALSNAANLPVTAGGLTKTVVISPETGRVTTQ